MRDALPASYIAPLSSPALAVSSSRSLPAFDSVGMRPLPASDTESSVSNRERAKPFDGAVVRDSQPDVSRTQNGQHAFTHHPYHHYDSVPPPTSNGQNPEIALAG